MVMPTKKKPLRHQLHEVGPRRRGLGPLNRPFGSHSLQFVFKHTHTSNIFIRPPSFEIE